MRILIALALLAVAAVIAVYAPQGDASTMHNVRHHVRHRDGSTSHFTRHELADARVVEVVELD